MTKKIYKSDQEKVNHREETKGHRTHKHHVASLREQEAMEEIVSFPVDLYRKIDNLVGHIDVDLNSRLNPRDE